MKLARSIALAAAVVTLAVPALASAQGQKAQAAAPVDDGRGYEYKFEDDDLLGGGIGGDTPMIRVGSKAIRAQLIRPRTSFVPELLKSADAF
jgi:hypothetical protein